METNAASNEAVYWALDGKQIVLARYCQELLSRESEDPDRLRVEFGRAKIELELTFSKIQQLASNVAINLPDEATVAQLQKNVAALAQLVDANTQLGILIAKGDELIKAWPN